MKGINYKALADWSERDKAKTRRWHERRGEEVPDEIADEFYEGDAALELLRVSAKVPALPRIEMAHLERLMDEHGIASILRTLHLLAYQKEQALIFETEFTLDAADPRPWHVMADALDELAGGNAAKECVQVTTGEAEAEAAL